MAIDIRAALTRRIGPLPTWAWVGVVGGGVFIGRAIAQRQGSSDLASGQPTEDLAETPFGSTALPVNVSGRSPDVVPLPDPGTDLLPIPEPIDVPETPSTSDDVPATPPPNQAAPGPILSGLLPTGGFGARGRRLCPPGFHVVRNPLNPNFGRCVPRGFLAESRTNAPA